MNRRRIVVLIAGALVAASSVIAAPAVADPGPGTWTSITSPVTGSLLHQTTSGNVLIAGRVSSDVTAVDLDCFNTQFDGLHEFSFASDIPVSNGAFATEAAIPGLSNCRLRAAPSGSSTSGYLGSYSGPILYEYGLLTESAGGGPEFGFSASTGKADGYEQLGDAGSCGARSIDTIVAPAMELEGAGTDTCLAELPGINSVYDSPTGSSIVVDGHNAYLPSAVHETLIDSYSLPVTQSTLTTNSSIADDGDLTVTESAPLMRCSVADTYPPTTTSCPNLVSTGVTFVRVSTMFKDAQQIKIRDSFVSSDKAAHTVTADYLGNDAGYSAATTGAVGLSFPGHSSGFAPATAGQSVSGFGSKAGTVLIRSDMYSSEGDPSADTLAFTWSRPPSVWRFDQSSGRGFSLPYAFKLPAGGSGHLGFAVSSQVTTSAVKTLAGAAVAEMVSAPAISSPKSGGSVKGKSTTVQGTASLGANGLPTSITVNGHKAAISKVTATSESWSARFTESLAKHTITVTAKDSAGNTRSSTETITNKK